MRPIRIRSGTATKMPKRNQFSQIRQTSTKVIPIEKAYAGYISTMSQGFERGSTFTTNKMTFYLDPHSSAK